MMHAWLRTITDLALSFTNDARRALFFARFEASSFTRREITLEHLLLGTLRNDRTLATALLGRNGVEGIVRAIEAHESNARRPAPREDLPLGEECKTAIARAMEEAGGSGAKVNSRHLLAAILHQDASVAARLLRERGLDVSRLELGKMN